MSWTLTNERFGNYLPILKVLNSSKSPENAAFSFWKGTFDAGVDTNDIFIKDKKSA